MPEVAAAYRQLRPELRHVGYSRGGLLEQGTST
jgi:hypothetical protein